MAVTQEDVRNIFLEKTNALRQQSIANATGIPREMLSRFMNGKRDLYPESLQALYKYLENI